MKNYIYYLPAVFVLALAAIILLTSKAFAFESPTFPTCLDTSKLELVVQFGPNNEGALYKTSDDTLLRCYCEGDAGLQTNLWHVPQLSQEELSYFQDNGWYVIDNGADVGLDEGKYLAKDSEYNCKDCVTPTPIEVTPTETASPSATPTVTPTPTSEQPNESNNSSSNGQVLGASGSSTPSTPTTLASTGTATDTVLSLVTGLFSLTGSMLLKKKLS